MAVKIQLRRGTTSEWAAVETSVVLAAGEVGVNTTTKQMKVGDGVTTWVNLPYFASGTITAVTPSTGITSGSGGSSGSVSIAVDPNVVLFRNVVNARGDILTATANDVPSILSLGTNGYALLSDISNGGNTVGLAWGQVSSTGLADGSVTTEKIVDSNVTTAKIADSNVTLTKLATAVQNLLIPAGTIAATVKSSADTGWLLLNGQLVSNAEGLYPSLFAAAPTSWRTGSSPNRNLQLPNASGRTLFGHGTTTLGATGGSNTTNISSSNLPAHTHTTDVTLTNNNHSHSITQTDFVRSYGGGQAYLLNDSQGLAVFGPYNTGGATVTSNASNVTVASTSTYGGGNGTATGDSFNVTNAHIAVNYQIKAH